MARLFIAWFGKPARLLGAVVIAGLLTLELRQYPPFLDILKDPFLRWFAVAFLLSIGGLATIPLERGGRFLKGKREKASTERAIIARLSDLTPHEAKVLQRYILDESRAENWDRAGGAVDTLARDGVLILIATNPALTFAPDAYALCETAWKHLHAHLELVSLKPRPAAPPHPDA